MLFLQRMEKNMEKYFEIIKKCPLFLDIEEKELDELLKCLLAYTKQFRNNDFIFSVGQPVSHIGIVLSGKVHVIQEDFWGNRTILAQIGSRGLFGEAFSSAGIEKMPVSVVATSDCEILFIDYKRIITTCSAACVFHTGLIKNMMKILAAKNIMLTQKMEFVTRKTTREKLIAFLSAQAQKSASSKFVIPFNRQQLADYLSVDRSAMSNELSKMKDQGIIIYHKNEFELLKEY